MERPLGSIRELVEAAPFTAGILCVSRCRKSAVWSVQWGRVVFLRMFNVWGHVTAVTRSEATTAIV